MLKDQGIALGPFMWGLAGSEASPSPWFLAAIPTPIPHLLPKETTQINNFCLVDKPPHPTCSPRVARQPSPVGMWELLVPDYSSLGSLNRVLRGRGILPTMVPTVPPGGCRTSAIA